jgi:predicted SAM-dependent methyltransferase
MLAKLLISLFAKQGGASPAALQRMAGGRAIDAYVASHPVRKLHLGAGAGSLDGWLSTDISPLSERIVYLDACEPFPIDDAAFDYVFSEHMIEHISWQAGARMLDECFRIMKPGATIRVATPDLAVLLALYTAPRDATAERYVRWITDRALPDVGSYKPAFVINNAFRAWGHQFLYDAELLETALVRAGFVSVRRCAYGESSDPHLRGVESHGHNVGDVAMVAFETMIFEADKPRRA